MLEPQFSWALGTLGDITIPQLATEAIATEHSASQPRAIPHRVQASKGARPCCGERVWRGRQDGMGVWKDQRVLCPTDAHTCQGLRSPAAAADTPSAGQQCLWQSRASVCWQWACHACAQAPLGQRSTYLARTSCPCRTSVAVKKYYREKRDTVKSQHCHQAVLIGLTLGSQEFRSLRGWGPGQRPAAASTAATQKAALYRCDMWERKMGHPHSSADNDRNRTRRSIIFCVPVSSQAALSRSETGPPCGRVL